MIYFTVFICTVSPLCLQSSSGKFQINIVYQCLCASSVECDTNETTEYIIPARCIILKLIQRSYVDNISITAGDLITVRGRTYYIIITIIIFSSNKSRADIALKRIKSVRLGACYRYKGG